MPVFVFDGTFEGLLTAVYEAYYSGTTPSGFASERNLQLSLLEEYIRIPADREKSEKVYNAIRDRISEKALEQVYHVFLSNLPDAPNVIYEYLRLGFRLGPRLELSLSDDRVLKVFKTSLKVEREVHLLLGFVRFRLLEGQIYYAPVKPDNNIVSLLAPHFARRLADQNWIIHDTGRSLAAFYNKNEWVQVDTALEDLPPLSSEEGDYQELWKEFFTTIAIKSRINPRLQRQLMPARYWANMTEKI